jgi:hypothetical protein
VLERDGFDELLDHRLLGAVEVDRGFEGEPEIVPGPRSSSARTSESVLT